MRKVTIVLPHGTQEQIELPDFDEPPKLILWGGAWVFSLQENGEYHRVPDVWDTRNTPTKVHYHTDDCGDHEALCGAELTEWGGATQNIKWITCKKCKKLV